MLRDIQQRMRDRYLMTLFFLHLAAWIVNFTLTWGVDKFRGTIDQTPGITSAHFRSFLAGVWLIGTTAGALTIWTFCRATRFLTGRKTPEHIAVFTVIHSLGSCGFLLAFLLIMLNVPSDCHDVDDSRGALWVLIANTDKKSPQESCTDNRYIWMLVIVAIYGQILLIATERWDTTKQGMILLAMIIWKSLRSLGERIVEPFIAVWKKAKPIFASRVIGGKYVQKVWRRYFLHGDQVDVVEPLAPAGEQPESIPLQDLTVKHTRLPELLKQETVLLAILQHLHYTDLFRLSLASKEMQDCIFPPKKPFVKVERLWGEGSRERCWCCGGKIGTVQPVARDFPKMTASTFGNPMTTRGKRSPIPQPTHYAVAMANYYQQPPAGYGAPAAQNLNFYQSSYSTQPVSGHSTPFQAYSGGAQAAAYPAAGYGGNMGFGGPAGVSGRMGEQGGLRTGWLAAFGTEGYDGEPPLLEELGVNFGHIKMKTLTVLNPLGRIDQHIMDDSDLAGPILFFLLFGTFLLFSGKVHFGYIYGLALLGSVSLHMILSMMSPPLDSTTSAPHPSVPGTHVSHFSSTLTFPRSASVLGYCLLPLVLTSMIGIAVPMDGLFGYVLTTGAILWCTYSSSAMFCAVGRMTGMRGLVAYPLGLFYVGFGIMGIFSSRGTGSLAAKTAGA